MPNAGPPNSPLRWVAALAVLTALPGVVGAGTPHPGLSVTLPSAVHPVSTASPRAAHAAPMTPVPGPTAHPVANVARAAPSVSEAPRSATIVNPLQYRSHEPAPMGIADFGVTGTQPGARGYAYATSAFEGSATVRSMGLTVPARSSALTVAAFELNAVVVLRLGGVNYTYWIQNGLHVNTSSRQFTIGGAYVWNFSSLGAHLTSSELRGNASSVLVSDTYYFIPGCGGFAGQCGTLAWPSTLTARIGTSTTGGVPYVSYAYDLGSGWVEYDNVSFLHMGGAADLGFVVDGFRSTPISPGLYYDSEWVWVAAGGGSSGKDVGSDLEMGLSYWNGNAYQSIPTAWNFGGNTGESTYNVSESLDPTGPGGVPTALVSSGSGGLGVLYNGTSVGSLNVSVPTRDPVSLLVDGVPHAFAGGSLNMTLGAGSHDLYLQNYSNASDRATVLGGSVVAVNLSGAGRVDFSETGLPPATPWSVALNGGALLRNGTSRSLSFNLPNGSYAVAYPNVPGYYPNASDPVVVTLPGPASVTVDWRVFTYAVPFTETGLPDGTAWWVDVSGGGPVRVSTDSLNVSVPNGSSPFTVGSAYEFVATPSSGAINVTNGSFVPFAVQFSYRPTFIAGTVHPANATVTVAGQAQPVVDGAFNDSVTPGTYRVTASAAGYVTKNLTVVATAGNVTYANLTLVALPSGPPSTTIVSGGGGSDSWLILGAVGAVAAVAIVAILAVLRRRS